MKIFMVLRNADSTEGRGPMVNKEAFLNRTDAIDYIQQIYASHHGDQTAEGLIKAGWWDIREMELHEGAFDPHAKARASALAKLTPAERELLGL